jgi:uncharacterized membrane protein YbhN (UPF0104 family)
LTAGRARLVRWALRAAGLALVAYVVAFQVRWTDEVRLVDGTTRHGVVVERADGVVVRESASAEGGDFVPRERVATTRVGERDVPAVAYGFPTLARRLAGSLPTVAVTLVALFALALVTAWRWRWLVHALGLALSWADAARLTLYGIFFNLVVPGATGGDVVKAWYAARRTGVPTKAVVSVLVDRVVGLFALVLLAAGALWIGPDRPGFADARRLVLAVLAAGGAATVLFLSRRVRRGLGLSALLARLPFQGVLREVDAAFVLYRKHPGALGLGVLVSLGNHVGSCLCAWALARALGLEEVTVGVALALVPVVNLLSAIPLLPGGWGVGELAFAWFFSQVGVAPSEAVGLSVVYRLALLASGLPGGALWLLARESTSRAEMAGQVARAEAAAGSLAAGASEGIS